MTDPNACEATACLFTEQPIEVCERSRCCYAWQRGGREERQRREERAVRELREAARGGG